MKVEVQHAQLVADGQRDYWSLELDAVADDGSRHQFTHHMPVDIFETRAAEYGFDPIADLDEVIELVLMEPHLPASDPADAATGLFGASSLGDARAHQRARVRVTRPRRAARAVSGVIGPTGRGGIHPQHALIVESSDTDDPLQVIREHSPMDTARIAVKREATERIRAGRRRTRTVPTSAALPTAAELRAELGLAADQPARPAIEGPR